MYHNEVTCQNDTTRQYSQQHVRKVTFSFMFIGN